MATAIDSILLANKDHDVLMALVPHYKKFPEWVVTIAFYKALHVVDAVCLDSGCTPCGHKSRLDWLKSRKEWHPIFKNFHPLWVASGIARYLYDNEAQQSYGSFTQYMPVDDVITHAIGKRLLRVEQASLQVMKSSELKRQFKQLDASKLPVVVANQ